MKNALIVLGLLAAATAAVRAQTPSSAPQTPPPQAAPAVPAEAPLPHDNLAALDAMTFGCPKAGLNAAAREAAKVKSQGTYQFSFFRIVSDSHHAAYEVHFKSNYAGEPELKYCVQVYCQQGWDPGTTKTHVELIDAAAATAKTKKTAAHGVSCTAPPPAKRR